MPDIEHVFMEYCCYCERETIHREVDDDVFFEFASECMICHTIWEAEEFTNYEME